MKQSLTFSAITILATVLVAAPTVSSGSLITSVFAKNTHGYCFVASTGLNSGGSFCFDNRHECKVAEGEKALTADWTIRKSCVKVAFSDKPDRFCFDLLPNDGMSCSGSKKACEDSRSLFQAGPNGSRAGPVCYKLS